MDDVPISVRLFVNLLLRGVETRVTWPCSRRMMVLWLDARTRMFCVSERKADAPPRFALPMRGAHFARHADDPTHLVLTGDATAQEPLCILSFVQARIINRLLLFWEEWAAMGYPLLGQQCADVSVAPRRPPPPQQCVGGARRSSISAFFARFASLRRRRGVQPRPSCPSQGQRRSLLHHTLTTAPPTPTMLDTLTTAPRTPAMLVPRKKN